MQTLAQEVPHRLSSLRALTRMPRLLNIHHTDLDEVLLRLHRDHPKPAIALTLLHLLTLLPVLLQLVCELGEGVEEGLAVGLKGVASVLQFGYGGELDQLGEGAVGG